MRANASQLLVIGSLNLDLVLGVSRMPLAGETMASGHSASYCGGKGANQAVACARMGATVSMIGRVGDDAAGSMLRGALDAETIGLDGVQISAGVASGVAVILLTPDGQNRIILAEGANGLLTPDDVAARSTQFEGASLLICQLETPLKTVVAAIYQAKAQGIPVLLNPAPAHALPASLLGKIDYLIPNESEASALTGIEVIDAATATQAALALRRQGARCVVITLGAAGILIADDLGTRQLPALPTTVIDTTAAGDSFIGGFAAGLSEGLAINEAARLGLRAASVCVSRAGAQASLPYRREV